MTRRVRAVACKLAAMVEMPMPHGRSQQWSTSLTTRLVFVSRRPRLRAAGRDVEHLSSGDTTAPMGLWSSPRV